MTKPTRPAPALGIMLRRWLLLMAVVVPTVGLGVLVQALVAPGDFAGVIRAHYGEHLAVIVVIGLFTLMLSITGAGLIGGGAGLRLRDFEDHNGKRLVKLFLLTTPVYLLGMALHPLFLGDGGNAFLFGMAALTPVTIENFLSTMEPSGRRA